MGLPVLLTWSSAVTAEQRGLGRDSSWGWDTFRSRRVIRIVSSEEFTPALVFSPQTNSGFEAVARQDLDQFLYLILFLARISSYRIASNKGMGDNLMERVGGCFMQKKEWAELPEVLGGKHSLLF